MQPTRITRNNRQAPPATIDELCDHCQDWADGYYQLPDRDGNRRPTGEAFNIRDAMRALRAVAGEKPPEKLLADDLYAAQEWMIAQGLARRTINARINRLRRIIRWAAKPPRRWVPSAVLAELTLVEPVAWGRTEARETSGVEPVTWERVTSTMAVAPPQLYTMIDLHWATGMRPGELVRMRYDELSIERPKLATGNRVEVMVYRPVEHKTRHHGLDRNIFLGPEARRLVEDWLPKAKGMRLFGYQRMSYRQAIERLNRKHGLTHWTPNQIRHAFATRMREQAGIDTVQVLMGHRNRSTTEIYAKPDCAAAIEAIAKFG